MKGRNCSNTENQGALKAADTLWCRLVLSLNALPRGERVGAVSGFEWVAFSSSDLFLYFVLFQLRPDSDSSVFPPFLSVH